MSSCCDQPVERLSPPGTLTIALAGNPNSGKTTLFNALTGLRQKVANYPGVTVEKKTGKCRLPNSEWADIIDLPGTYSLISRSPDELVAMEVLRGLRPDTPAPDAIIVVVDASNLQRNLYLVSQLIELGRPMVVALNMMDIAQRRGLCISPQALQQQLGIPVIPVIAHKRKGIDQLKAAITHANIAPFPDWPIPQEMKEELLLVGGALAILDSQDSLPQSTAGVGFQMPCCADHPEARAACTPGHCLADKVRLDRYKAIAERLLIGDRANDLAQISQQQPVASLLASANARMALLHIDPMQTEIESHYRWIEQVAAAALAPSSSLTPDPSPLTPVSFSDRVDSILIHRVWGLITFALIMGILFVALFWLAKPMMDAITHAVDWTGHAVALHLPEGPIKALITDGIFAGVGAVVVFVPQIALLFLFLGILEDSGYLARAAFLMDRLLSRVGLHGKSFIPLLSSFACAIPGIMATRTIENRKDRLATILIAPFMSCSARLPVYTLLIGLFFASHGPLVQAGVMLALYALGIVAAALTAWCLKRSLLRGPTPAFILELPTYKLPQLSQVIRQVWTNSTEFLKRAGTTIFCMSIVLWALTYYPRLNPNHLPHSPVATAFTPGAERSDAPDSSTNSISNNPNTNSATLQSLQREHSFAGQLGHAMEPIIRPLGYNWKMGVGLVGAFAAREVFVSTIAITYAADDPDGGGGNSLQSALRADRYSDGRPVWTPLVATSLLVWFVLAMQCMSTLAVVRRETNGWKWPLFMIFYMNSLAYVVSLLIFQIGSIFLKG